MNIKRVTIQHPPRRSLPRIPISTVLNNSSQPTRSFSFSSIFDTKYNNNDHRHEGIEMHPQSISNQIQPGNFIIRPGPTQKKRYTEFVYGYFWMLKDLSKSNEKPILSNFELIPEAKAKTFPRLSQLKSLTGQVVNLPEYLWRKNRTMDAHAQCTIVAVSFRDFGYRLLSNWLDPFREAFAESNKQDRVEVIRLNISEGWFHKYFLKGFILGFTKNNTPAQEHDQTFVYFGSSQQLEIFRDSLRMHNAMTGYVFLLDGLGRVRFAGCGPATDEEVERLVGMANELMSPAKFDWSTTRSSSGRGTANKRPKRR
jgi:ATPase complex subunit ATP10